MGREHADIEFTGGCLGCFVLLLIWGIMAAILIGVPIALLVWILKVAI